MKIRTVTFLAFWLFILGLALGSIAERRNWMPSFSEPDNSSYSRLLANTKPMDVELQKSVSDGGIRLFDGDEGKEIVVFTDFQCPYCRRFHEQELPILRESGFAITYRHYPLQIHKDAAYRAAVAECVYSSGVDASTIADSLFGQRMFEADSLDLHELAGTHFDEVSTCIEQGEGAMRVSADTELAKEMELKGTPVLIVSDKQVVGAFPADDVIRLFESRLR